MIHRRTLLGLSLLTLLGGCGGETSEAAAAVPTASGDGLAVVELYQSQGCSSCLPAIHNVNALADRKDLIVLMFSVTYWDYLGWKDSNGKAIFTDRQYDYANAGGSSRVYTPQVVVNGATALVGNQADEISSAIRRSGHLARLGVTSSSQDAITLASMPGLKHAADVWLVRYDPKTRNIPIRAGENAGRTIAHRNIVVDLQRIGSWNGKAQRFMLPPPAAAPNFASALLVQQPHGGPIIAAARL